MACQKYTLINTGSTITTFNYQSCSDTQWRYNVNLYPGQTKSVWALNNTFQVPEFFLSDVVVESQGDFPPCDFNLFGGCYEKLIVTYTAETNISFTVCTNSGPLNFTNWPTLTSLNYPAVDIIDLTGENWCISGGTAQEISGTSITSFVYSGSCCEEVGPTPTPTEIFSGTPTPTPTMGLTPTPTPSITSTSTPTNTPAATSCYSSVTFDISCDNSVIEYIDCCGNCNWAGPYSAGTGYTLSGICIQNNSVAGLNVTNVVYDISCNCPATPTPTPTNTETPTATPTPTETPIFTGTTLTPTPTNTETPSSTPTPTQTQTSGCISNDCYEFLIVTFTAATEIGGYYCEPEGPVYDSFMIAEASYPATQSLSASYCFSAGTWGASGDSITSLVYSGLCCEVTPTPTPTISETPTETPTNTPTPTETEILPTPTPSPTCAPTNTPTPSCSPTYTPTPTCEPTGTPTPTCSPTKTCTPTPTVNCCEIQILTNISQDVDIESVTVNGGIPEYVSGQPLPNGPGTGTVLCSTTAGTVDIRVSVFNSVAAQKVTLTDSLGVVYCSNITGTGPSNHDFNGVTLNCVVPMTIIAEDGSCSVPPTPSPTQTLTNTPTNTPTPTSTDLSLLTIYTISGCTSLTVIVADLISSNLFPGDTFDLNFTGATPSGCYTILGKTNTTPTDGSSPISYFTSCAECLDQTTTVYSISGCTNMVTLNADLLSPNLFPGDVLYIEFTGLTANGCYTVIEKMFDTVPADTVLTNTSYGNCGLCEDAIVTPTPTNTETPTPTPTITSTVTPTNTETPTPTITPTQTSTPPLSGLTVTVLEVGSDVVWSGSGTLNLGDLSLAEEGNITAGFSASQAIWAIGPTISTPDNRYSGSSISYPSNFGAGATGAAFGSGAIVGVLTGGSGRLIVVPSGYTSNTFISGTTTYTDQTFSSMGLVEGIYSWTWGVSPNEGSINMTIGAP